MSTSVSRDVAVKALSALVEGDTTRLKYLLAPDAQMRITGDFGYSGTLKDRAEILKFIADALSRMQLNHPCLRFDGSIRRIVADGELVAAEIKGASDYASMIIVKAGLIASMTMYFDTRAYAEM